MWLSSALSSPALALVLLAPRLHSKTSNITQPVEERLHSTCARSCSQQDSTALCKLVQAPLSPVCACDIVMILAKCLPPHLRGCHPRARP